ncbi:hypothetical protein DFH09DRAFT_596407 [Mycena vulgaris]|nr:hypothetical protein DFH09DRAFT_596407 [Mycena vulgaris]
MALCSSGEGRESSRRRRGLGQVRRVLEAREKAGTTTRVVHEGRSASASRTQSRDGIISEFTQPHHVPIPVPLLASYVNPLPVSVVSPPARADGPSRFCVPSSRVPIQRSLRIARACTPPPTFPPLIHTPCSSTPAPVCSCSYTVCCPSPHIRAQAREERLRVRRGLWPTRRMRNVDTSDARVAPLLRALLRHVPRESTRTQRPGFASPTSSHTRTKGRRALEAGGGRGLLTTRGSVCTQSRRCEFARLRLHPHHPCVPALAYRLRARAPASHPRYPHPPPVPPPNTTPAPASLLLVGRCAAPPHPHPFEPKRGRRKRLERWRGPREEAEEEGAGRARDRSGEKRVGTRAACKADDGERPVRLLPSPRMPDQAYGEMMGQLRLRRGAQQAGSKRTVGWAKTGTGGRGRGAQAELVRVWRRPRHRRGIWDGACAKRRGNGDVGWGWD